MHLPESAREWFAQLANGFDNWSISHVSSFRKGTTRACSRSQTRSLRTDWVEPVLLSSRTCGVPHEYAQYIYDGRKNKGMTEGQAEELAGTNLYTAAIMVATGDADGLVGGAAHTTADTVRAAFRCIGPAPGVGTVSSYFVVAGQDRSFGHGMLIFADCAIVINPTACELADMAIASAGTTADAALVPSVGQFKAPGSIVAGYANTLIFPDVGAGLIAVKLVERLGYALTLDPFLLGLAKPANDLSRECSADDIYASAVITALQSVDAAV